jgi:hypothetical protein
VKKSPELGGSGAKCGERNSAEELSPHDPPPQAFKASPYFIHGQKRPGKLHALREHDLETGAFRTWCGLRNNCPGQLIEFTPDSKIDCQVCLRGMEHPRGGWNELVWTFRWYDGDETFWTGFVNGEEIYGVNRGTWWCRDDDSTADACESDTEGRQACAEHLQKRIAEARRFS